MSQDPTHLEFFEELTTALRRRQAAVLCTVIRTRGSTPRHASSKMLVYPDGRISGTIGGGELENRVIAAALQALQEGKPQLLSFNMIDPQRGDPGVCGGTVEVFVEPILPPPALLVIGGGHVGKAVVHLGAWLGFHVILSDDRPEFCNPQAVPGAHEYFPIEPEQIPEQIVITPYTWVVLTTRGTPIDVRVLPSLLQTEAAYIGVIGSKRRWATTRRILQENGIGDDALQRVRAPIGLELEAETPEEIALSILAEILMLKKRASGRPMSE